MSLCINTTCASAIGTTRQRTPGLGFSLDGHPPHPGRFLATGALEGGATDPDCNKVVVDAPASHPFVFGNAYEECMPKATFIVPNLRASVLDQIWFSKSRLERIGVLTVEGEGSSVFKTGLPDKHNPSDHLPVGALLQWLPPLAAIPDKKRQPVKVNAQIGAA